MFVDFRHTIVSVRYIRMSKYESFMWAANIYEFRRIIEKHFRTLRQMKMEANDKEEKKSTVKRIYAHSRFPEHFATAHFPFVIFALIGFTFVVNVLSDWIIFTKYNIYM